MSKCERFSCYTTGDSVVTLLC